MDFGEKITFDEVECKAMEYHVADGFENEWALELALILEGLVLDRINDKRSLVEELQQRRQLGQYTAKLFEVRAQIAVLESAHDQLIDYCLGTYNRPPTSES